LPVGEGLGQLAAHQRGAQAARAADPGDGKQNRRASVNVRTGRRFAQLFPETMTDSPLKHSTRPKRHNRWLILIAAFKLAQALLFVLIGVGALQLLHKDIGDVLARLADHLRFNPESRFVNFILDRASLLDDRLLRRIGEVGFIYAGLDLIEGIGLYLEKAWAEYLTLAITASFLPWEIFEVIRRLTWVRSGLLVVNALVFFYLVKLVAERGRQRKGYEGE
jgi:uncharacterized membrane protein (DUF2068 family)